MGLSFVAGVAGDVSIFSDLISREIPVGLVLIVFWVDVKVVFSDSDLFDVSVVWVFVFVLDVMDGDFLVVVVLCAFGDLWFESLFRLVFEFVSGADDRNFRLSSCVAILQISSNFLFFRMFLRVPHLLFL